MAPTRVGILGLSKSGWAPNAHLPYLLASPAYEIVALCNSSVESAQSAIKLYNLPATTKAYGNPEDLANDANVDLVVCSVRVDRHFATISPALKKGKDVFVEWPLGKSAKEARELLRLKNEGGVKRAVVGLQARQAPVVHKLKQLIESGKIGEVLSSTWTATAGGVGATTATEATEYLGRKEVGGNLVTIHFGHSVDYVQYVLGYGFKTIHSLLANRRTHIALTDAEGKVIEPHHRKNADDTIFLNGTLSTGIPLSMTLRGGQPFKGAPGLVWSIYGSTGEIRITAGGPFLQIGYAESQGGIKVEVHSFGDGKDSVEEVETVDELEDLPMPGRNVARVYKELEEGKISCTFEDAVDRHTFIEGLYKENGYEEA